MRPVIGITCAWDEAAGRFFLADNYVAAVEAAGGLPLPLAYTGGSDCLDRLMPLLDGLVLSGGGDVDPFYFGEEPVSAGGEITPLRDQYEIELCRKVLNIGMPVLGICRGAQVLNISAGGDIYQDISLQACAAIKHSQQAPRWHPTHRVAIEMGTSLAAITGCTLIRVNSFHHQAVKTPAPGFTVSARSEDGIIEAVEKDGDVYVLGVQWHPEAMFERCKHSLSLFRSLVQASLKSRDLKEKRNV